MSQSALQRVPEKTRFKSDTPWFPIGASVLDPRLNTVELTRAIGEPATYQAVKQWRLGLRGAPQWAVDKLAAIVREQALAKLAIANNARPGARDGTKAGTIALHKYRLQCALEKERAPN